MKLVILDRDGTINYDSDDHIRSPNEWRPIEGSLEAIARLAQAGYRIVVATNQSGISRGLFDTATLIAIHDTVQRAAMQAGGRTCVLLPALGRFGLRPPQASARGCCSRRRGASMSRSGTPTWSAMRTATRRRRLRRARRVLVSPARTQDPEEGNLPPGTEVFENLAAFAEHLAP
jgi:D-glycero-D-manno-heptose 1,7-bisphosphate phosphatase